MKRQRSHRRHRDRRMTFGERLRLAVAKQHAQNEMLRREAWAWNAPVRATAKILLAAMRGDA